MTIIFALATILLGFFVLLFAGGHMMMGIFVSLPVTRVFVYFRALKPFKAVKGGIAFNLIFFAPLLGSILIVVFVAFGFFLFISNFLGHLIVGYILGALMILVDWYMKNYSFNKKSFHIWFDSHRNLIDFDYLRTLKLDDEDKLFEVVSTWVTPRAQSKIKKELSRK